MLKIYRIPESEPIRTNYTATVEGAPLPVLGCRVSAQPINRRWPGHQRQPEQAEDAYFARFASDSPVTVSVTVDHDFKTLEIRPLWKEISYTRTGNTVTFTLPAPGGYTVEPDGFHHALHLFFDAPMNYPAEGDIVFGPGEHHPGLIRLAPGQTLYIDEDAIVYGQVEMIHADGARILGRGILDNSENHETILFEMETLGDGSVDVRNSVRTHTIEIQSSNHCRIEGITIRDSLLYNVNARGCRDLIVDNIKTIGCWRYNSDGVDLHNCSHCVVRNCFIRTYDDSLCVKAHMGWPDEAEDILFENNTVWNDWNHALEIGAECCAHEMKNIVFRNNYIIHGKGVMLSVHNVDFAHVHDVLYQNISAEYDEEGLPQMLQRTDEDTYEELSRGYRRYVLPLIHINIHRHGEYSVGEERGSADGLRYENIRVYSPHGMPPIVLHGCGERSAVRDLSIRELYLNGRRITDPDELSLKLEGFAEAPTLA